jgi:hypothetical protein
MHTNPGGPLMIFFFAFVTVIVPTLVLVVLAVFTARNAAENRHPRSRHSQEPNL